MKQSSSSDISIGGAELAGQAIAAGVVDELQLLLVPVLVGGGKRALPTGIHGELELLDEHRFQSGFVFLRYRV
jgi:dihydrofolate reductase